MAGKEKVCPGFLFHRRGKSTNLIDTVGIIFIGLNLEAYARHDFEINRRQDILESVSTYYRVRGSPVQVLRIEPTSSPITQPAKRTNEFSNRSHVFIRPTCLMLSLNKKFEATLTQDILHQCIHKSGS